MTPYALSTMQEKRDVRADYLFVIKTALRNTIQNVNFADLTQTRREHEALMNDINREVRHIGTKYSVQIEPLFLEWDTFISILEKHFPDILDDTLNCDNQ